MTQTTTRELPVEVNDIYIRNGVLTADTTETDIFGKQHRGMINLGLGGTHAKAVLDFIDRRVDTAAAVAGVRDDD